MNIPGWRPIAIISIFVGFLAFWQWGLAYLGVPPYFVPPVTAVIDEAIRMVRLEQLGHHVMVTFATVIIGFAIGSFIGMVAGYVLGLSRSAELILSPYILGLQLTPKVAFAPLFILWLGYTIYPKILVAVLIVFFPVMINVLGAVRSIDPDLFNLARAFSAHRGQLFWKIEVPASLPPLFSGLRIASTLAVIGVIVGGMVGGSSGLGYLLVYGEGQANIAMVFVVIVLLTVIGSMAYWAVVATERWVLHWMPRAVAG